MSSIFSTYFYFSALNGLNGTTILRGQGLSRFDLVLNPPLDGLKLGQTEKSKIVDKLLPFQFKI
jgi:hypothetical protein